MRVVLDTNVLVSLVLGGALGVLADWWEADRFRVVVSTDIVSEYAAVLARPKFGLPRDIVEAIITYIQRRAEFVVPTETITAIADDIQDNKFLVCGNRASRLYCQRRPASEYIGALSWHSHYHAARLGHSPGEERLKMAR